MKTCWNAARRRRNESGYVLLIVLVACGIFGLIVMSLLAMVGTDARASSAYLSSDAAKRAVDGALQLGIGQVKAIPSSDLAGALDACAGFPATSSLPIEGRTVDITCAEATEAAPKSLPSSGDGATVLTLLSDWNIGAQFPVGMGDNTFGAAVQELVRAVGGTTADNPGLIHLADEPLKIYGGVNVRQWSLTTARQSFGAGLAVSGTYREGDSQAAVCGTAEPFLSSFLFDPPRTGLASATGGPICNAGRDNVVALAGPTYPVPTATSVPGVVPACVASGGVVAVQPGAYDVPQVAQLNQMFGGACPGVTFWFPPGEYFFDAADNTSIGALFFNEPTSNVVFGEPKGWPTTARAPDSVFPEACDRAAQGVTIVLGATTSIIHRQGAVSMCGRMSGNTPVPVLSQLPAVTLPTVTLSEIKWATEPTTAAAGEGFVPNSVNATNATNVAASVAAEVWSADLTSGKPYDGSEGTTRRTSDEQCTSFCGRQYLLSGFDNPASPGSDRPLTEASIKVRASASNVAQGSLFDPAYKSRTRVDFKRADGAECWVEGGYPSSSMSTPMSINLLANNCVGVIRTPQDLELGSVKVYFLLDPDPFRCEWQWTPWAGFQCITTMRLSVDYMWVETRVAETTIPGGESPQPPPLSMQIDAANRRTVNIFGRVALPRTQIDVKWTGAPTPPAYELPVFVGDVVARGMISSTPDEYWKHIGPLAARTLVPTSRRVTVRASIGDRLLGSTVVELSDIAPAAPTVISAAETLQTTNWNYCNVPLTPTATC